MAAATSRDDSAVSLSFGFVGAGRLGQGLAVAASAAGYPVVGVASQGGVSAAALARRLSSTEALPSAEVVRLADVVVLAVPDRVIRSVSLELPWREGQIAVHASAIDGPEALASARRLGAQVGTFHPLLAFGDPAEAPGQLRGSVAAIDGDAPAVRFLREFAHALGCRPIRVDAASRALYHAAAVMSSNYVATLLDAADRLWRQAGLGDPPAPEALGPLTAAVLAAATSHGAADALTGPIARGDVATVRRHLDALASADPDVLALYCAAGLATVQLAERTGRIAGAAAADLRQILAARSSDSG